MDIQRALVFLRDDEKWVSKLAIGTVIGAISMVTILPIFLLIGYSIQIARNTMDGFDSPLPEWDEWGKYFKDGLVVGLALLVYSLPLIALVVFGIVPIAISEGEGIGVGIGMLFFCVAAIYGIAMVVVSPAVYIQYIREGTFGACLRFSDVLALIRENFANIFVVVLVLIVVQFVMNMVGGALLFVFGLGIIVYLVAVPYTSIVTGHLYGQLAAGLDDGNKGDKFDDMVIMS